MPQGLQFTGEPSAHSVSILSKRVSCRGNWECYAERIRHAHDNFGVRDFVILMERGDVKQSLCGSGNVNGPCLDAQTLAPRVETIAPPGTVKKIFRHSALAQYVFGQLRFQTAPASCPTA